MTLKKNILVWILFGIIFNLYSLSWLYTVYPLTWMTPGLIQILGIILLHLIVSISSGFCFFIVGFSYNKKIMELLKPFFFSLALVTAEIFRSIILSLLFYGNNSTVGLNWTAGTLGNSLSTTPFIEYAYFGGTYMLTFILGYLVSIFISKKHFFIYWKHFICILFGLILLHFLIPVGGPQTPIKVAIVTTNFELPTTATTPLLLSFFREQAASIHILTKTLASSSPDIIVYPEDTRYISHLTSTTSAELFSLFKNTLFVDGGTRKIEGGYSNYSLFYTPTEKRLPIRGKSFLMPFNEYLPLPFKTLLGFFLDKENIDSYAKNHTYTPEYSPKVFTYNFLRVGTLLCSEILSFTTIYSLHTENPDIVFYQSRLNVFHNNPWFIMHMRSFSKIAAAQLRIPLLESSNGSPSFVISPHGKIIKTVEIGFSSNLYIISKEKIAPLP